MEERLYSVVGFPRANGGYRILAHHRLVPEWNIKVKEYETTKMKQILKDKQVCILHYLSILSGKN